MAISAAPGPGSKHRALQAHALQVQDSQVRSWSMSVMLLKVAGLAAIMLRCDDTSASASYLLLAAPHLLAWMWMALALPGPSSQLGYALLTQLLPEVHILLAAVGRGHPLWTMAFEKTSSLIGAGAHACMCAGLLCACVP